MAEDQDVAPLVTTTLAGLARHTDGPVLASRLKRAVLRKDPTFDEADHGFRGFGELLRNLEGRGVVTLRPGSAQGDPEVAFPEDDAADDDAFALLVDVVRQLGRPQLSGLKNQLRKREPGFSEKRYGFNTFLSFVKAARTRGLLEMDSGRRDRRLPPARHLSRRAPRPAARRSQAPPTRRCARPARRRPTVVPAATRNAT